MSENMYQYLQNTSFFTNVILETATDHELIGTTTQTAASYTYSSTRHETLTTNNNNNNDTRNTFCGKWYLPHSQVHMTELCV